MNQQRIATAIVRALAIAPGGCMTLRQIDAAIRQIDAAVDTPTSHITTARIYLESHGLVEHARRGGRRLTAAGLACVETGVIKQKTGVSDKPTAQQTCGASGVRATAWNALRNSGALTIEQSRARVDDGSETNARRRVTTYFAALAALGIVMRRRNGLYVLLRNLGPIAPTAGRGRAYDPNAGAFVTAETTAEAAQ